MSYLPPPDNLAAAIDTAADLLRLTLRRGPAGAEVAGANPALLSLSGHAATVLHGMTLASLAAAEANAADLAALEAALAGAPCGPVRLICRRADAATFVFDADALICRDTVILLGRDATLQARAAEQQLAAQALLATVFLSVPVAVAVVGDDGRFQMTNPEFDRMTGYARGEMIGRPSLDLLAESSRAAMLRARERQAAEGTNVTVTVETLRKDGASLHAEISSVPVRGAQGAGSPRVRILLLRSCAPADQPAAPMLVAGRVRLIGLTEVRAELGDRWPAVAQRALATAEHVIRKRLAAADTFAPTADEGFLICFATASEEEASFRAATIGREIRQRLIGGGEPPAVAHVTAIAQSLPAAGEPPPKLDAVLAARLDARMEAVQANARALIAAAIREARCEADPIFGRAGRAPVAELVRFPRADGMALHAAAAALPAKDAADLDLDGFLLRLADSRARSEAMLGGAAPILVNVGFDPFLAPARTERYVGACRTLAPAVQQRLILLLSDFPSDLARLRVEECIWRLRPFCRAVGFQIDDLNMPPVEQGAAGGTIVALPHAPRLLSAARSHQFAAFLGALTAKRCKLLLRDVPDWEEAERLRALGVDLISIAAR